MLDKFLKKPKGYFLINKREGEDPYLWLTTHITLYHPDLLLKRIEKVEELGSFSFFDKEEKALCFMTEGELLGKEDIAFLREGGYTFLILSTKQKPTSLLYSLFEKDKVLDHMLEPFFQKEKRLLQESHEIAAYFGKEIEGKAALSLTRLVEEEALFNEIMRLSLLVGEKEKITLKEVEESTPCMKEPVLFSFSDAIFEKKIKEAALIGQRLLHSGTSLFVLLRAIRNQVQVLLQIEGSSSDEEILKVLPYMKGKLLEWNKQRVQRFKESGLKRLLLLVDRIEAMAKEGEEESLLLELFIGKV